jgi:hypothetical protein
MEERANSSSWKNYNKSLKIRPKVSRGTSDGIFGPESDCLVILTALGIFVSVRELFKGNNRGGFFFKKKEFMSRLPNYNN